MGLTAVEHRDLIPVYTAGKAKAVLVPAEIKVGGQLVREIIRQTGTGIFV